MGTGAPASKRGWPGEIFGLSRRCGKAHHDTQAALMFRRFERNGCMMAQHHILDDGQAQPAAVCARTFLAGESVEGPLPVLGRNTGSVVSDRQFGVTALRSYADIDAAAALGIADSVVDKIAKHRAQSIEISRYPGR